MLLLGYVRTCSLMKYLDMVFFWDLEGKKIDVIVRDGKAIVILPRLQISEKRKSAQCNLGASYVHAERLSSFGRKF